MRAAGLTAQLLAFSRKQMLQPRVLDTHVVLTDVQAMLRRLVAEDIELSVDAPPGLWPVKADRGQLEQVIVNLAVNARDAMPHGGSLKISAANDVVMDPIASKHGPVPPGEYVAIRVTDTGLGMDTTTQAKVFEPFFTTKAVGQGTGLGLATVHGIVAQSGGHVTVESEVDAGTTFTVYLPRVHELPSANDPGGSLSQRGNNEAILLVEDEPAVRALARRVLVRAGFRVLEAQTPGDALRLAREHASEIRLVLSDVVMPEMSGPVLVSKVAEVCPSACVLYISGYTDDEVIGRGLANPGMQLLQKPFSAQQLVERVRATIDVAPRSAAG
jgi:CheY-like chemotaxis protein